MSKNVWRGLIAGVGIALVTMMLAAKLPTSSTTGKISVVDDVGQTVTLKHPATRIVVIEPSNAEIVLDLGLRKDIVGADSSVFQYVPSPWKKETRGLHSIGPSYPSVSEEAVVAARPDLVIASAGIDGLSGLKSLHIPILYLEPASIAGVYHDIALVGAVTGRSARASRLIGQLKTQMAAIHDKVLADSTNRPTVFLDLGGLYSAGPKSFINSLMTLAGARNIVDQFSHQAYPEVTAEQVVRADPDVIIVDPEGTTVAKEEALAGFSAIRAVIHHHVYALPQPSYIDQPSPGLVLGLEELVRILHPGLKP